jgi:uncharacterized protein (DUF58 family)
VTGLPSPLQRALSPRARGLLALAGAGLVAALAAGRPELAVLAVPVVVFVSVGLALAREPRVTAAIDLERTRLLEGDRVRAKLTVANDGAGAVEAELTLAHTGRLKIEPAGPLLLRLQGGATATVELSVGPEKWGAHTFGPVIARARDPLGLTSWTGTLGEPDPISLRVFPHEQRLRELVAPRRTQPFLGAHVARARGMGIEFADIRPFGVGDRVRHIHWRATARRGALQVTERHPEHATDVVLLLDTFEEARAGASGTLDAAVRAVATLARGHLARRDRVGLVDFGGTLHWLEPSFGTTQLYRIIDALIASEIAFSYAWREVDSIPRRVIPPGAMILAVSPLLDERSIRLVTDLRRRGSDLTVIEVSPLEHIAPGPTPSDRLGYDLWRLRREALRTRLRALGIGVAVWEHDDTLGPALEGVNAFRRSARHALRA